MRETSPAKATNAQPKAPSFPPMPPPPKQNQNANQQAKPNERLQRRFQRATSFHWGKGKAFGKAGKGKGKTKKGQKPPWVNRGKGKGKTKK